MLDCSFLYIMRLDDPRATALPVTTGPVGTNPHYETESRAVWNELTQRNEVHEFVYEVTWIPELNIWRRFLRTHHIAA